MSIADNPYIVDSPVSGKNFYGRREIFEFLDESLAAPNNRLFVLHGQHRVGKSSVLHELHLHRLPKEQYCAVRIDVQGQAKTPFSVCIHTLATLMAKALAIAEPKLTNFEQNEDYFLETFLPDILSRLGNRRLVIMIDEFDALADDKSGAALKRTSTALKFLPMVRNILDNDAFSQVVLVLGIGRSLEKLPPDYNHLTQSARFNRIWLLSRADTAALITQPARGLLNYEQEAIDRLWHYTAGQPYFTQLLCYEVFNRAKQRQQPLVKANDVDPIIDKALETGLPAFTWLWDDLSSAERLLMAAIGSAVDMEIVRQEDIQRILDENRIRLGHGELVEAAGHLVKEQVLQLAGDNGYRFEVELVRQWIKKNHSLTQEKLKISEMSPIAAIYYNVARRSYDQSRLEEAIDNCRLALKENPNHFNAQLDLAQALQTHGNLAEAVDEFERAYWLNEQDSRAGLVGARMALAEKLETLGDRVKAASHYRRVYELAPTHRPLQEKLRLLYSNGEKARKKENWGEAAEYFERVVEIAPDYKDARQLLRQILDDKETAEKRGAAPSGGSDIVTLVKEPTTREEIKKPVVASYSPKWLVIGAVIVLVTLVGSVGGWLIWGRGTALNTSTPTPAIVKVDYTPTPTPQPTSQPTPEPTQTPAPTQKPTEEPTPEPTKELTIEPTTEPTQEPTVEPTPTSTVEPTKQTLPEPATPTPPPAVKPKPLPSGEALDIDINPTNPKELFALLKNGGVYRTQDGGNAWKELQMASSLGVLAIAPGDSKVIYVGGYGQVLKSDDGGNKWAGHLLPGSVQVYSLAIDANKADIVYAATEGGILVSQNGGQSWETGKGSGGKALITPFYAVTMAAGSSGPVYAAGQGDVIYRAEGPEAEWQAFVCQGCVTAVHALAAKGDSVYAGGALASLARSDNRGSDWKAANNGLPTPSVPTLDIASIVLAPDGQTIYAGTGFRATNANGLGVARSADGGNTWTYLPLPPGARNTYHVQSIAVDPHHPTIIYIAGFGGVYKSENGGQTWVKQ